jgi:hypothetical protein
MRSWKKRNYLDQSPQFIKQEIFLKYGIKNTKWVETGTCHGVTTKFLSDNYPHVYSIEPSKDLYDRAVKNFKGYNIDLFNDVSEYVLPDLLSKLNGDINFWLDGHYSGGVTFKGEKDCPVEDELLAINKNISNFTKITILIDDIRCFSAKSLDYDSYPSIDYLVDWSRNNKFNWKIEHDIFIMQNY